MTSLTFTVTAQDLLLPLHHIPPPRLLNLLHTTISRSSVEAELRAMVAVITEVTWLRWLLKDFYVMHSAPTPHSIDSISVINVARDPMKHEFTKHIGVDASYMRSHVHD